MTSLAVSGALAKALPTHLHQFNPVVVEDLVRIGNPLDGGYLVPRSVVAAADALLSFGLGTNWSFEQEMAQLNPHILIHIYDHTVSDRKFMEGIAAAWKQFRGTDRLVQEVGTWVDLYDSYRTFFGRRFIHFQERVFNRIERPNDATVEKALGRLADQKKLILKMDIEGGEYRVLDDVLAYHERISAMVVEFHSTQFLRKVFVQAVERVLERYEIVHLHGNNYAELASDGLPDVLEITFLHRSLCGSLGRRDRLPLAGLDFPNDPARADLELVFVP